MDRETEAQIDNAFTSICHAADARQVTHSSINTDNENPARRKLIADGLKSRLHEKYPRSLVVFGETGSGTITVSITHR